MMTRIFFTLIFLFIWLTANATSSMRVHPLHLEASYRQDFASVALRDRDGFLWIGTDNGLKRYDGYNLRSFFHDPDDSGSIGSPDIHQLLLQEDGTLWAAGSVLSRYHRETETFSRYFVSNFNVIYALEKAPQGHIWIGGDRIGLLLFDPDSGEISQRFFTEGETPVTIYQILNQRNSTHVWLATDLGLLLFDPVTGQTSNYLTLKNPLGFRPVMGITQDDAGTIWAYSREGLYKVDPANGDIRHFSAEPGVAGALFTDHLTAVTSDQLGNIWLGTDKEGVFRYDPRTDGFTHFPSSANDEYHFPPAAVTSIHADAEGTLWFACGTHGVFRISPHVEKFTALQHSFDSDNSLGFNHLLALHEDTHGYVWIATDGNGVDRFDPRTRDFKHFRHDSADPESLSTDSVMAIAEDPQGYIWLGTWAGGLNRLDPDTGKVKRYLRDPTLSSSQTLAENHIFRIEVDPQGRLIMAVGGSGLQIFDPQHNEYLSFKPDPGTRQGIRNGYINDILPTGDGRYWLAGYQGIELFSPATNTFHSPAVTINDAINDLHMDPHGIIWMATNRGLQSFNPANTALERYSIQEGLSDDHVVGIEQDNLGFLWVATRNGLNRFNPENAEVDAFDQFDGLAGTQFNRFSHMKTRAGTLYFGSNKGLTLFDPLRISRNEFAPHLHLTGLEINHELQLPQNSPWLTRSIEMTEAIVLPSTVDHLRITFAATNLIAPNKNRYRYRLKGQSDEWITASSDQRSAQFNNLRAGDYTLQLLASNNDGVWTGATKDLQIRILPAWWQTWWAYGLYGALFISTLYGFSVWRLRMNEKRRRDLEAQVREQTAKLRTANRAINQLNSELEQRVAQRTHELSSEIEERKISEANATYIAYHDSLSGLYNRAWLLQHLEKRIHQDNDSAFALLFVGGDRFRKINDTYGHRFGDQLLIAAARKLTELCGEFAHAVRLGSDEFAMIIDKIESRTQVVALAETVAAVFKEPFVIDQVRLNFGVSVGFVIANQDYVEPAQLLRNANLAMQKAKDRGRGVSQEFDADILQQTLDRATLENDLKMALERNQLSVVFQPIVRTDSARISGFEILARWRHPERGMIPPDVFIAMAESLGLIFDIGLWVLEQACQQLQLWEQQFGAETLPVVAVNLSPLQLEHVEFLKCMDAIMTRTGTRAEHIEFEITESALLRHTDTVDSVLEALRQRGIKLAIDDFGTGYSSLSYLDKLPVQLLKIDRSFTAKLTSGQTQNQSTCEIVRTTISLAHSLNMRVVAEGIETAEQLAILQSYGCDFGQGYLIARPLSPNDATAFLTASVAR